MGLTNVQTDSRLSNAMECAEQMKLIPPSESLAKECLATLHNRSRNLMLRSVFRVAGDCLLALVAFATASSVASAAARAYVPNSGDGTISVIDTGTGDVIATIDTGVLAGGVAISPDGLRVYIAGLQGVIVIDAVANQLLEQPSISGRAQAVSVSADGSTVYVSGESIFAAYDSNTLAIKNGVPTTRTANITLSPEGSRAFVADPKFAIFDVDLRTWEPRRAWSWWECRHPADTAASPDGARLSREKALHRHLSK